MLVSKLCKRALSYKRLAASTQYGWKHSARHFEHVDTSTVDREFCIDHRCELLELDYAEGYIRTQLGYLGSMWERGLEMGLLEYNPWRGLLKGLKQSKKKYPHKQFDYFKQFHDDPLFMAVWLHGFRISEIACLLPEDFVTDAAVPYINIEHNHIRKCKNDYTQRHVPIHPSYYRYINQFPFTDNPNAGDYFSRKLKKATGISAHGIRHSFITRMRQAGIEYSIAMAVVGHKPSGMTASYGDVLLEDMANSLKLVL